MGKAERIIRTRENLSLLYAFGYKARRISKDSFFIKYPQSEYGKIIKRNEFVSFLQNNGHKII